LRKLSAAGRGALLLVHLAWAAAGLLVLGAPGAPKEKRDAFVRRWSRRLLVLLGIRLLIRGRPRPGGTLFVSNHVSWLDGFVLLAALPVRFVAKEEVRGWPLVGWLASRIGTLFIKRGSDRAAKRTSDAVADALAMGDDVAVFPEGTSTDGSGVLAFRPALFESAILAGRPVQPVAIAYSQWGARSEAAPFIGDDTLVGHLVRLLSEQGIFAELVFIPPLSTEGSDRQTLAFESREYVSALVERRRPMEIRDRHLIRS
jgi:1-acyl-sn-glycerol-3-phosphate acyltransferase